MIPSTKRKLNVAAIALTLLASALVVYGCSVGTLSLRIKDLKVKPEIPASQSLPMLQ